MVSLLQILTVEITAIEPVGKCIYGAGIQTDGAVASVKSQTDRTVVRA